MSLDAAHRLAATLRGEGDWASVTPAADAGLPDPRAGYRRTVQLRGLRDREDTPLPWPSPGWLASMHATPRLGALVSCLDIRDGAVHWHLASAGEVELFDLLAASAGRDRVLRSSRAPWPVAHEGALVGLPCPIPVPRDEEPPGVDLLLDALPDRDVSFVVVARPATDAELLPWIRAIGGRIDALAGLTEVERRHADVAATLATLEDHHAWLVARRSIGLWRAAAVVLAEDEPTLTIALAALSTGFGRHPEGLRGLRAVHARPGATIPPDDALLGSAELARLLQPPRRDRAGFERLRDTPFHLHPPTVETPAWHLGRSLVGGAPVGAPLDLGLDRLTRHALVCGITGSGKTHTVTRLLQEAHGRGVPFLVVEPAKREHRRLLSLLGDREVHVWTAGAEHPDRGTPLRLDPFSPPEGTPVGTWLDGLLALFEASFALYPPMPYVLAQGIRRLYAEAGWDVESDVRGRPVLLDELISACEQVIEGLGYAPRIAADVRAALRARLNTLTEGHRGLLYGTGASVDDTELFDRPTVVELDALPRAEDKAFAMGLLILRLSCHRRFGAGQGPHARLRHLLVVEEAHRLLRAATPGGAGEDSSRAHGIEQITDLISEVRAYGQGVIIADQIPSRLAEDAIKNTDLKLVHRTVASDDRALLAGAMALDEEQERHLARLARGEVVVYQEPMDAALVARVAPVEGYDDVPDDGTLAERARRVGRHEPKPFSGCTRCPLGRTPCGPTFARARRAATASPVARDALRRALGAAPGTPTSPNEALAWCTAWQAARGAATALYDAAGLSREDWEDLTAALVSGTPPTWSAPREQGPLLACSHCPTPCRWLPLGRRLARPDADWHDVDDTPAALATALRPVVGRVCSWGANLAAETLRGAIYCVAAHEQEDTVPAHDRLAVAAATARHVGSWEAP